MNEFDDIIHLSRPVSKKHPPMPLLNRAAQFGAFRALTGHEESIKEEARLTDTQLEIGIEKTEELNLRIQVAKELLPCRPLVVVTHFVPDEKKDGGKYVKFKGNLRIIDNTLKLLIFTDGTKIPFSSLYDLEIIKD